MMPSVKKKEKKKIFSFTPHSRLESIPKHILIRVEFFYPRVV